MKYIFKYEDSMRQCETLLTENIAKLYNYSEYLLQSSSLSSSESTERDEEYEIMKMKLDTAQENIATLKSEYNDLTLHSLRSSSFENNFKETFFKYLARQEPLRLKFIETINVCKQINSHLGDILRDCSVKALNENCIQNTSKCDSSNTAVKFDLSSIPKVYVLLPKLDLDYGFPFPLDSLNLETNSFSNERAKEYCTSTVAFASSKSPEVSSSDLNSDVAVKKCDPTIVLETKKSKNFVSSKRSEIPNLSQSQSFVCNICHQSISKKHIRKHVLSHEGLKPFECADCGKSFARKENIKTHILSKHMPYQSRPYRCDTCSKFFSTRSHLNNHRWSSKLSCHSTSKSSRFSTPNGTKKEKKKSTVSTIQKKVPDRRQSAVCDICNKNFSCQRDLKRHMSIHEDSSNLFVCNICDQNFSRRDHLKRHIMVLHECLRPFKCPRCDKAFGRKDYVKQHMLLMHNADINELLTSDSYYYCAHCKYRCESKECLVYHIKRRHISNLCLDEFSCTVCGKTFTKRYHRARHEKTVHVEEKCFCCTNCGNRYKYDSGLAQHLRLKQCMPKYTSFACELTKDLSELARTLSRFHLLHCDKKMINNMNSSELLYYFSILYLVQFYFSSTKPPLSYSVKKYNSMRYVYNYEDSMRQCETLLAENFTKLSTCSKYVLQSQLSSSSESTQIGKVLDWSLEYIVMKKKLDTVQENISTLKSQYSDLTRLNLSSRSFGIGFKDKFFNYLVRQEALRLKFIKTIKECKLIKSRLDNVLDDCTNNKVSNEDSNQTISKCSNTADNNLSTVSKLDVSSLPSVLYVLLPKLDWDYDDHPPTPAHTTSFSNEHREEISTSPAASDSKSPEVSSSDLNSDVGVKKCSSTNVLETKRMKNSVSSKRNEGSNLSQSLVRNICHRNVSNKGNMKRHMFSHKALKPFKCTNCGKSFPRKDTMRSHIFSKHMPYQSRPYKCDTCSKFYSSRSHLNNHRCSTSTIRKKFSDRRQSHVCNICPVKFSCRRDLERHILIHKGLKPFKCAECGKSFRRKQHMKRHIRLCHSPYRTKPYKCNICDKLFTYQWMLNDHKRRTRHDWFSKLSEFSSSDVGEGVTVEEHDATLEKVEELVSSKRKKNSNPSQVTVFDSYYHCAHCNHRCRSKEYLVHHIKKNHISNLSLEEFGCTVCGKMFTTHWYRKQHEQTVHAQGNCFCCTNCGQRFKHGFALTRHLKLEVCKLK
ncbi:zinc finger protein 808-like [Planococcus citri]|uniref:zinc finger protein 808-like n=1 Tax=Planococcus citri TaxID=170843 RepID=UPI0031F9F1D4